MGVDERHPVMAGLTALVAVGLAVGVAVGLVVLIGTRVLGLGGGDAAEESTRGPGASLYLPDPTDLTSASGPLITLSPAEGSASSSSAPAPPPSSSTPPEGITLQADGDAVGSMECITLSGSYPDGDGAVLQVQRRSGGAKWERFPVTTGVTATSFSTCVRTGRLGAQDWRVKDADTGELSNPVTVTVG